MTFRAIDPASAKIYYALEADRPLSTLNIPDGSLVIFTDSGLEDSFDAVANAWFNREQITPTASGEPAGLVVSGDLLPTELAIPQIDATDAAKIQLDAGTGQLLYYTAVVINPLDDVEAAQRFIDGDFVMLNAAEIITKQSDSAITDVYIVGFGDVVAGGVIEITTPTLAEALAQQSHWTFDSIDNVKKIQLTASPLLTTNRIIEITLQGAKHV